MDIDPASMLARPGMEIWGIAAIPRRIWRRVWRDYLHPAGIGAWRPLVPLAEFSRTVEQALDRLLEREEGERLGAYLEFGVSRGTSMACMHGVLARRPELAHVRLLGFDSFQGLPTEAAGEGWRPGMFHSTLGATRRYLARNGVRIGDRVHLVKGWFDATLTPATAERLALRKASLIMFDCDTYASTRRALEFSLPLIDRQAAVIFDDWGAGVAVKGIGQREAFREMVGDTGEFTAEPLPVYRATARAFLLTRNG
jgi:O-methyltransferase